MLATLAHSSLQELSTNIRFPGLGAEDKKAKRMKADEGTGLAIGGNVSPQLTLYTIAWSFASIPCSELRNWIGTQVLQR